VVVVDPVVRRVLEVVAAQTGYPPEMLDLDLDLEADLGIDTVKQAETFAAIREEYGIGRDDSLALRDYPTLAAVVGFVRERRPDLAPGTPPSARPVDEDAAATGATAPADTGLIVGDDEAAAGIERRVVVPVLRPPVDAFVPTGVTLGEGSRVVVVHDAGGVGTALAGRLEKMGVSVLEIDGAPDAAALGERLTSWAADGPVHGVYWLPALDDEGDLADLAAWREALRVRVKLLYATMRTLYDRVTGEGTFLVTATRLGGRHGYDDDGAVAPLGGPVVGFAKAYKREQPGVTVKAVDFAPSRKTAAIADRLIDETLADPGVVEVGYAGDRRWAVSFEVRPLPDEQPFPLDPDTVFVVTGAAGSITSAITADLAAASGGTFYLLDLVPEPDPSDPDLVRFAEDRDGLKVEIFERLKATGERATPAMVDKELTRLERAHAALAAIRAVEHAGGTARYHSADLRDPEAVAAAIADVRETSGKIDALLHAGGIEISRSLPDKSPEEFDLVFDIKADGWFNLLDAIGDMPLGATVGFSSVAGRFGNGGQTDYSAANDLLCKAASSFRTGRPGTRGIAIDWTAWGGIGMATRGSIPTMMKAAGIDMLPAEAGIPIIRRELVAGTRGELVIGKALGILTEPWHPTGGLDPAGIAPGGVVAAAAVAYDLYRGFVVETTLDPGAQPFLDDHRIDGTPVLPGVMGIEAFVETARMLHPDLVVTAVEDVEFLTPFKFYRDEPRTMTIEARFTAVGEGIAARCTLVGTGPSPVGRPRSAPSTSWAPYASTPRRRGEPRPAPRASPPAPSPTATPSTPCTSTVPPTGSWTRRGGTASASSARWRAISRPTTPRTSPVRCSLPG
jgi:NAD(P)-dependent dehydrogenase (short-subunit alcohol dehydrogenase family)/acyl carrier protein